eukprot:TRINITY_DN2391_c0_g1_i2.p1 TRINITY_DN2391_c0_g1~~TRINITY_DN2391_c0_g1_i2.p1  ORF type:complete len:108 (+),score=13.27 TRINITY_DN2391_c0_g1_i2:131-454(+)
MAMLFCPRCSVLLGIKQTGDEVAFTCSTCIYKFIVQKDMIHVHPGSKKAISDVEENREGGAQYDSSAVCQQCGHHGAHYHEIQLRSADEPATIFFNCEQCNFKWKEG